MTRIATGLRPGVVAFYASKRPRPVPTPTESADFEMRSDGSVPIYVTTFYRIEEGGERLPISSHVGEVEPTIRKRTERQAYPLGWPRIAEHWAKRLGEANAPDDVVVAVERDRDDDVVAYTAEWYEVEL